MTGGDARPTDGAAGIDWGAVAAAAIALTTTAGDFSVTSQERAVLFGQTDAEMATLNSNVDVSDAGISVRTVGAHAPISLQTNDVDPTSGITLLAGGTVGIQANGGAVTIIGSPDVNLGVRGDGIVLQSPTGVRFRVTVDEAGTLQVAAA